MPTKDEIDAARVACDKAADDVQKAVETVEAANRILARRMDLWRDAYYRLKALLEKESGR